MDFLGRAGSFESEIQGSEDSPQRGTEGHRGLLGICAFSVGRGSRASGLGPWSVHSPRIAQVDFSVKVRCHKKKINIWAGCGKLWRADKGPC
jgi:hypothetical protein